MKAPRAAILAVGSELLGVSRLDTNSLWLAGELEAIGIALVGKACVGDAEEEIAAALDALLSRAEVVLVTGGLGPTEDDRTKETLAKRFGRSLRRDEALLARLRERFARRGVPMPAVNEKQADVVEGARVLENPLGSAPGVMLEEEGRLVALFPGVPPEMKRMFTQLVRPALVERFGAAPRFRRILKIAAMGESAVEQSAREVYARWPEHDFTILSSPGEVQLHLSAAGSPEEASRLLDAQTRDFEEALPGRIYGRDEETLESVVGELLRRRRMSLALAESCTGGMIGERITRVPGSSDYFVGGVIGYADDAKEWMLSVRAETLGAHGAVSRETAVEMAEGALGRLHASVALSVTGIAGPAGGSFEKPVGTVWIGLAQTGRATEAARHRFPGGRDLVRAWACAAALELLRRRLLEGVA